MRGTIGGRSRVFQRTTPAFRIKNSGGGGPTSVSYCETFGTVDGQFGMPAPTYPDYGPPYAAPDNTWEYAENNFGPSCQVVSGQLESGGQIWNQLTGTAFTTNSQLVEFDIVSHDPINSYVETAFRIEATGTIWFDDAVTSSISVVVSMQAGNGPFLYAFDNGPAASSGAFPFSPSASDLVGHWRLELDSDLACRWYRDSVLQASVTLADWTDPGLPPPLWDGPYVGFRLDESGMVIDNFCWGDLE